MSEKEFTDIFSKRLRYYLNKYDITQVELSKQLGVGTTSVYNWCNGIKIPRMDKIDAMCKIFDCKRSDLMEESKEYTTLAAHFAGDDFTREELEEIEQFARFVKSKRNQSNK